MSAQQYAMFYKHQALDGQQTLDAKKNVYVEKVYVQIRNKGEKNAIFSRPMREEDKTIFQDAWANFNAEDQGGAMRGYSISALGLGPDQVEELNDLGLYTVHDLAELSDGAATSITGGYTLKRQADAWLEAQGDGLTAAAILERDQEIEALKAQIAELKPKRGRPKKEVESEPNATAAM